MRRETTQQHLLILIPARSRTRLILVVTRTIATKIFLFFCIYIGLSSELNWLNLIIPPGSYRKDKVMSTEGRDLFTEQGHVLCPRNQNHLMCLDYG